MNGTEKNERALLHFMALACNIKQQIKACLFIYLINFTYLFIILQYLCRWFDENMETFIDAQNQVAHCIQILADVYYMTEGEGDEDINQWTLCRWFFQHRKGIDLDTVVFLPYYMVDLTFDHGLIICEVPKVHNLQTSHPINMISTSDFDPS